jgi:hypothetical protein
MTIPPPVVGIPVFNGETEPPQRPASAPPLRVIAEMLREQLDLSGNVPHVVEAAEEVLGLTPAEGANLMTRARQCHVALNGDGSWGRRPGSARQAAPPAVAVTAAVAAVATPAPAGVEVAEGQPLEDTAPPSTLKCRGVEFGFQSAPPPHPHPHPRSGPSRFATHELGATLSSRAAHPAPTPTTAPTGTITFTESGRSRRSTRCATSGRTTSTTLCPLSPPSALSPSHPRPILIPSSSHPLCNERLH